MSAHYSSVECISWLFLCSTVGWFVVLFPVVVVLVAFRALFVDLPFWCIVFVGLAIVGLLVCLVLVVLGSAGWLVIVDHFIVGCLPYLVSWFGCRVSCFVFGSISLFWLFLSFVLFVLGCFLHWLYSCFICVWFLFCWPLLLLFCWWCFDCLR